MTRAEQGFKVYNPPDAASTNQASGSTNSLPAKMKLSRAFEPCPFDSGDEMFCNGIFEFDQSPARPQQEYDSRCRQA